MEKVRRRNSGSYRYVPRHRPRNIDTNTTMTNNHENKHYNHHGQHHLNHHSDKQQHQHGTGDRGSDNSYGHSGHNENRHKFHDNEHSKHSHDNMHLRDHLHNHVALNQNFQDVVTNNTSLSHNSSGLFHFHNGAGNFTLQNLYNASIIDNTSSVPMSHDHVLDHNHVMHSHDHQEHYTREHVMHEMTHGIGMDMQMEMGHGGMMMHMGHGHGMMNMFFSLKTNTDFLLEGIKISTLEGIIGAMIFTLILTLIIESLAFKIHLRERHRQDLKVARSQKFTFHLVTSVTHLINVGLANVAMLCVMTMNIWLFTSVVVGSGIGHLLVKPMMEVFCAYPRVTENDERIPINKEQPISNGAPLLPEVYSKDELTPDEHSVETDVLMT